MWPTYIFFFKLFVTCLGVVVHSCVLFSGVNTGLLLVPLMTHFLAMNTYYRQEEEKGSKQLASKLPWKYQVCNLDCGWLASWSYYVAILAS